MTTSPTESSEQSPGTNATQHPAGDVLMTSFPVTKRKRATRAKFSKVRTGCVTCKFVHRRASSSPSLLTATHRRRHVKCDETKPACRNCLKWAGYCGGYEVIHQSTAGTDDGVSSTSPGASPLPSPGLRHPMMHENGYIPAATGSVSPPTDQYYDPFDTCLLSPKLHPTTGVSNNVPWCFDPAVWDKGLTELMQGSAAIRHANLAVHTLVFSKSPTPMSFGGNSGRDHYGEALICHGLALHEAGRATSDLREAVICCMFFVVFETINGDRQAAHSHVQSGKKMLWELSGGACQPDEFQNSLRYVVQYIAKQAKDFRVPRGFPSLTDSDGLLSGFVGV